MVPKHSDAVAVHSQNAAVWSHSDVAYKESGSQFLFDRS